MENNKALVWIRDDFRVNHNSALAYASENHEQVSTVYIFNPEDYENKREAQRWWIYHSLINFKQELSKFNISLELLVGDEVQVLKKIKTADNVSLYWNKIPEPEEEKKETKIIKNFEEKNINYKFFKGNILSEHKEVTKDDGTPFKVFTPFWRVAEQVYLNKVPSKKSKTKKKNKKKVKQIKGQLGKKKETAREKMIGQSIGYRYDVNLLPDYSKITPFLKKYIEAMGWDDLNWLEDVHMGYEDDRPAVFCRNANGWVTIPKTIKLPNNQQDRDMIARELLVKFQMSPKHPLVDLKKAYLKF